MTFDGIGHRGPIGIPPGAYHPYAPSVPIVAYGGLVNAYFAALENHRTVIAQDRPFFEVGTNVNREINSGGVVRFAEGDAYIPSEVTHLIAAVYFTSTVYSSATLSLQVDVTDIATPSNTAQGTSSTRVGATNASGNLQAQTAYVDVDISGLALDLHYNVRVSGNIDDGTSSWHFEPYYTHVVWEVRS